MTMSIYGLEERIAQRAKERPTGSYTTRLLDAGVEKCAKKTGEEAVEFALAAMKGNREEMLGEAADLIYHFLVTLKARDISLKEVEEILALRDAQQAENPKSNHRGT